MINIAEYLHTNDVFEMDIMNKSISLDQYQDKKRFEKKDSLP